MSDTLVQIGMDDIDSPTGRCTTHFASLLVEHLSRLKVKWTDYPNLVRLNPGIPYRTRGNGAVALRFLTDDTSPIFPMVEKLVDEYIDDEYPNTNPGVVIFNGGIPRTVKDLSQMALWRVLPIDIAKRLIKEYDIVHYSSGNGRGLIGALSAAGNTLQEDHTYEYIAYRALDECGNKRGVNIDSVHVMMENVGDCVFANIDETTKRVLIEPHGPDPVLFGVRGETTDCVINAGKQVRSKQIVDRWMVFRSNQGTGEHLKYRVRIKDLRPYMTAVFRGRVSSKPRWIEGGHVIFSIIDEGRHVDCAVYEPSGEFRETVMKLLPDDVIDLHAGVRPASRRHGLTLNVEGLEVVELVPAFEVANPICSQCGKRMKSAGTDKGFKCVNCGHKDSEIKKVETPIPRDLHEGFYLPPARAQRHLTRPHSRMNKRNSTPPKHLVAKWHSHS